MTENHEYVVLVDEQDIVTGKMEKMEAHEKGVLHRAFSVFLFNSHGEMLLQQRAHSKYHSPGLWTNACCSHPRMDESLESATTRRLSEEMGMQCTMQEIFHFIYKADVGQGLTEHELDHVFVGTTDAEPALNPDEVADWKYMLMDDIKSSMLQEPEKYTVWFRIAFDEVYRYFNNNTLKK